VRVNYRIHFALDFRRQWDGPHVLWDRAIVQNWGPPPLRCHDEVGRSGCSSEIKKPGQNAFEIAAPYRNDYQADGKRNLTYR
jgi:hypothetical protein